MKLPEFEKLLERRIDLTKSVLANKNKEYASDDDKLHNFKRAGDMSNETPPQALWGMMVKHLVWIHDQIDKGIKPSPAETDEKIGD